MDESGQFWRSPPLVTALPTAALKDGQEVLLLADASAGVIWRFRYRAGSPNQFKWELVGGAPMYADIGGAISWSPAGQANWVMTQGASTVGPDIVTPIQAVYRIRFGARVNPGQDAHAAAAGISLGAGNDPSENNLVTNGNVAAASVARTIEVSLQAAIRLRMMYRDASTTGTATIDNRWMEVIPLRAT